jgi:hypothetical protein
MSDTEQTPVIQTWAEANGFEPSDVDIAGVTPLLRLGMMDVTADAFRGEVGERRAVLAEFSIGTPSISEGFGGSGVTGTLFTVFLLEFDAARWRRLTVHPREFGNDRNWSGRLLHRDREVEGIGNEFDERYRVIASTAISDEHLHEVFSQEFVSWYLGQDELVTDIEDHGDDGGYLLVGREGVNLEAAELDRLRGQAERVAQHVTGL